MRNKIKYTALLIIMVIMLTGCDFIAGVFKTGVGVGIMLVIALLIIIVLIARIGKMGRRNNNLK